MCGAGEKIDSESRGVSEEKMGMKRRAPKSVLVVTHCANCPCMADHHEDEESVCQLNQKFLGPDEENLRYQWEDPAPVWCPLREGNKLLVLEEG